MASSQPTSKVHPPTDAQTTPRSARYRGGWNIAASLLITGLTIGCIEACSRLISPIPSPSPILLLAVCSSAFLGGLPAGVLSAAMCMLYGVYFFADLGRFPFQYSPQYTMRLLTLVATAPSMAILVGLLRGRSERAAAALSRQQSERRFLITFDRAAVGMATVSLTGQWMRVNPKLCEILGVDCDHLIGKSWDQTIVRDDAEVLRRQVRRLIAGELESFQTDTRHIRADGRTIWTQQTITVIRDDQGTPDHLVAVINDISDRKSAEDTARRATDALRRSDRQFRQAIVDAPIPVIMLTEDGQIIQVSRAWTELSGYTAQDIPNFQTWLQRAHGQDAAKVEQTVRALFDAVEGAVLREQEFVITTKSGEQRVWSFSASSPGVMEDGRRYMVAMARDVTLRKRAEHALAQSELRCRSLVSATAQVIWTTDAKGQVVEDLPTWREFTGQTFEQLKSGGWVDAVHPDDREHVAAVWKESLESKTPHENEFRVRAADGTWREMLARAVPVIGPDGELREWVGSVRDVTDRRQAVEQLKRAKEAAEAANRAKDQFLAALSHELRTPLTPVLLSATALSEDDSLPAGVREELNIIRRNVELEARLIDDLLDLTRIARGKLQLDLRPIDAMACLQAALDVCRDDARAKSIVIELSCNVPGEQLYVRADSSRLQQVFWNLLKNAVKFTSIGGEISIGCTSPRPGMVRIDVSDSGIGIDPQALPKIFDAFEQGNDSVSRQFGGLGLGLAITKRLVEMHGGRIKAFSEGAGQGSIFSVELPSIAVPKRAGEIIVPTRQKRQAEPLASPGADLGKPLRILLVEDHDATSRVLSMLLRRLNHDVTTATDLASARLHAQGKRFDLLISDIGLPDGSGLDLMRELREKYHDQLKGICLSGYGMDQDVIESRAAGFSHHLTKPIDFPRLKATIDSVSP